MKIKAKIKILLVLVIPFSSVLAQEVNTSLRSNLSEGEELVTGIQFFKGTWEELLAEAQQTDKPIFVDVYTDWCVPCKMMVKNIFPLEKVGEVYNNLFINYQIDAEKGKGPEIAQKYNVYAYPTYLYLTSEGELVHRGSGYNPDPDPFIKQAKVAAERAKDPYTIGQMEKEYLEGKRDKEFLGKYISRLTQLKMENREPLDDYLKLYVTEEQLNDENISFILENVTDVDTKAFVFLMKHVDIVFNRDAEASDSMFVSPMGKPEYRIPNLLIAGIRNIFSEGNYAEAAKLFKFFERLPKVGDNWMNSYYALKLRYFSGIHQPDSLIITAYEYVEEAEQLSVEDIRAEDKKRFADFMKPYLNGEADSTKSDFFQKTKEYIRSSSSRRYANKLNIAAQYFYEKIEDEDALQRALGWSRKATELMPNNIRFMATYTRLLYKTNQYNQAIDIMKKVVSLAREQKMSEEVIDKYLLELENMQK